MGLVVYMWLGGLTLVQTLDQEWTGPWHEEQSPEWFPGFDPSQNIIIVKIFTPARLSMILSV